MEWWRVLWLVSWVTGNFAGEQAHHYDYSPGYMAEDEESYQQERYYLDNEGPIVSQATDATEDQELIRIRRYGTKDLKQKNLNDIKDVLKDILAAQGIEKFFASSTFVTTLTNTLRSIDPSVTETMLVDMLTTFVNNPTRSSQPGGLKPTHSPRPLNITSITEYEGDLTTSRQITARRFWNPYPTTTTESTTEEYTTTTTPSTTTTQWGGCVTKRRRTTTTPTTTPALDVDALLAIIANLTYDYDTNFTRLLNESLQQFSIPTCFSPTTTTEATTSPPDYSLYNATVMGKCFVCGLEQHGVPVDAYCADAFAGDFIPLVPVDPKAKGQVSVYRKYCRYRDVHNYVLNESLPRSIFGRWTGGCSVRWIDLSGVYTQRSCRNRHRAVLGRHYGSKRMAKLEMALQHVDNGCIISPMATLVPLSRGISLYARFHACVCTGSWCNWAARTQPSATSIATLLLLLLRQIII